MSMSEIANYRQSSFTKAARIRASKKENGSEIIDRDRPPKLPRLFFAIDHTTKARQCLPSTGRYHSTEKTDEPNCEETYS
jgi:hypothetical protein